METLPRLLLEKYRLRIGIFLITVILVGGGALALMNVGPKSSEIEKVESVVEATISGTPVTAAPKIKIDVAGAVANPGVYELPEDSRVGDALNAAGGLSPQADSDWIAKNLNLAAKLHDGDKIYISGIGETSSAPASPAGQSGGGVVSGVGTVGGESESAPGGCSRVNINTASAGTLDDCLSGIGPAYAQRIIEYRESHGGFKNIEEIQEVRGIGPKTFEKIKDQITVD